jgi:hypothetical protein
MIKTLITYVDEEGLWVFDDDSVGLVKEAFVLGTDELIEKAVAHIPNAREGFALTFSDETFDGFHFKMYWVREAETDIGGNFYYTPMYDVEGWLCPSLYLYFEQAPKDIYVRVDAIQA